MTLQDRKRMRTFWLMEQINSQGVSGLGYKQERLLGEFCLFFGASMRGAPDYLKELEAADKIVIKDEMVYSRRFFDILAKPKEEVFAPDDEAEKLLENLSDIIESQKGVEESGT